jgi:hypothetical protein
MCFVPTEGMDDCVSLPNHFATVHVQDTEKFFLKHLCLHRGAKPAFKKSGYSKNTIRPKIAS